MTLTSKARLLKMRLKIAADFNSGPVKQQDIPTEGRGVNTRRENPATPLKKKVPFGKKPTGRVNKKQQIERMLSENAAVVGVTPKVAVPKATQQDFQKIISAKQRLAKEHNHMIDFKRHFKGADQFKRASLESQDDKYAHYWLLNAKDNNGNGWGVAQQSIAQNIKKFIGKPFVITSQQWVANSEYGEQYEHPYLRTNDLNIIYAHQEKFRVGTIHDVKEKNGEWFAQIKMKPKYAGMRLPPFCSPAIFQIDPMEAEGNITKWEALHLAGLIEDPAYGARIAILRGSCMGTEAQCSIQFKTAKTLCPAGLSQAKQIALRLAKLGDDVPVASDTPEQARARKLITAVQKNRKLQGPMNTIEGRKANKLFVEKGIKINPKKSLKLQRMKEALKKRVAALHRGPEPTSRFNKRTPLLKKVPFGKKPTLDEARKDVISRESTENVRKRKPGIRVTPGTPTQRDRARIIQAKQLSTRISGLHGGSSHKKKVKKNGIKAENTKIKNSSNK